MQPTYRDMLFVSVLGAMGLGALYLAWFTVAQAVGLLNAANDLAFGAGLALILIGATACGVLVVAGTSVYLWWRFGS